MAGCQFEPAAPGPRHPAEPGTVRGTNDPTTAVHVLGHLSSLLCMLVVRDLHDETAKDEDGVVRAILRKPGFEHFLALAVSQSRHYGMQDRDVGMRLLALFDEVNWCDRRGTHSGALRSHLSALRESIGQHEYTGSEKLALTERYEQVRLAVHHRRRK